MKSTCTKCKNLAVTYIRYNGTHLCKEHFIQYFEKRVKKEINKQGKFGNKKKIGIAVSGGKDSIVCLYLINKFFSKRKDFEIISLTVDEGINNYRDISLKYVIENSKILDIEYKIISFKEIIGKSMDEIASLKENEKIGYCSYCGVFRRLCLNYISKKMKISKLIMGHNLDDMSQSILMNFINSDIKKLARLGPHIKIQPGLVPRLMPLRVIPEKEITLYALLNNISYHDGECPYSYNAFRGIFRDIINNLEYINPGTRHSIIKSYDSIKDVLIKKYPPMNLNKCNICNEPTSQITCKACILKKKLF
jgi:uncharacterized protein (TIGR00269 family)